ncbi:MAG: hypothetical protein AAF709_19815 [Pseudomonadota bacterium]
MATFTDNFNRPDGAAGSPWSALDFGGLSSQGIVSNQYEITSSGDFFGTSDGAAMLSKTAESYASYYTAEMVVPSLTGVSLFQRYIIIRDTSDANSAFIAVTRRGATETDIVCRPSAGASTQGMTVGFGIAAGDRIAIYYDGLNGLYYCAVNGFVFAPAISLAFSPGVVGIAASGGGTTTADSWAEYDDEAIPSFGNGSDSGGSGAGISRELLDAVAGHGGHRIRSTA